MFTQAFKTIPYLTGLAIVALGSLVGCDAFLDEIGGLGQDCTSAGICEKGLVCSSGTCIKESDAQQCSGSCDEQSEPTKCASSDDLCACVGGTWKFYFCDNICDDDGLQSNGCGIPSGGTYPYCLCANSSSDGDGTTDGDDSPDGDNSTDGDNHLLEGMVGASCYYDSDCVTDFCLTDESAAGMGLTGITVLHGYCSYVMCNIVGDEICNDVSGGECFSLYPFMGLDFASYGMCFRSCDRDADCRVEDNNVCLDPYVWVQQELLSSDEYNLYYDGLKVCVPYDLAAAASSALIPDGDWDY